MPSATVTVKYVNPPRDGSKRGSIKTVEDEFYGVWENLHRFQPGQTYEIQYTEKQQDGRTFRNVKSFRPVGATPRLAGAMPEGRQERSPDDTTEQIGEVAFVSTVLTAFIRAGKIDPEPQQLVNAATMLRRVFTLSFQGYSHAPPR